MNESNTRPTQHPQTQEKKARTAKKDALLGVIGISIPIDTNDAETLAGAIKVMADIKALIEKHLPAGATCEVHTKVGKV